MSDGCGTIGCSGCDLTSPTGHGPDCPLAKRQPDESEEPKISTTFLTVYRQMKEFFSRLDKEDEDR